MDLLVDEKLSFTHLDASSELERSDAEINKKYSTGEVRIVTEAARYPLSSIPEMIASDNYELNPEFQRRHRWTPERQSKLIESLIMNVPIPPIFLYENEYSHYQVMDGLQRLTAIKEFYNDQVELVGLQEWPELNGRTYSTLPDLVRRGVDRRYISSIILLQETAKEQAEEDRLKQLVFERINSGGVRLAKQEARNAIYDGPLNKLCIRLSRHPSLCKTWGIPVSDELDLLFDTEQVSDELLENADYREMKDVELVLRFFAFRQREIHNTSTLWIYLDNYLNYGNQFSPKTLAKLESIFVETITLIDELFGESAFWVRRKNNAGDWVWRKSPTTVIYDPMMAVVSRYTNKAVELKNKREVLAEECAYLYDLRSDLFAGRAVNPGAIDERELQLTNVFESVLSS